MGNSLELNDFNKALCEVRKAHRLIYAYQRRMLDLTYFIKSKLGFPNFGGNKCFSGSIEKKRDSYDNLRISKNMWAWDFLYSYVFEYYLGQTHNKSSDIAISIYQVTDTGYFDNENSGTRTDLATFAPEEDSISKLIFLVEKKPTQNEYIWKGEWAKKKICGDHKRMSRNHSQEALTENGNIQIIYSIPLNNFLNESTTLQSLTQFVQYCNENGIPELKMV